MKLFTTLTITTLAFLCGSELSCLRATPLASKRRSKNSS